MEFEQVSQDLAALVGKQLRSIGGKSELRLTYIDPEAPSWKLIDSRGRERSRPISELEAIWGALKDGAPAHVESVLLGSGSSRNQPETLIANLPYVEWARIGGRKHLVYVRRCTHDPGTLRRMDSMAAAQLNIHSSSTWCPSTVLITEQTKHVADVLVGQGYSHDGAPSPGAYRMAAAGSMVLVVDSRLTPSLECGVYPVLRLSVPAPLVRFALPGLKLYATRYLDSWVFVPTNDQD